MIPPVVPLSTTTTMYRLKNIYGSGATPDGAVEDRSGMYRLRNVYDSKSVRTLSSQLRCFFTDFCNLSALTGGLCVSVPWRPERGNG